MNILFIGSVIFSAQALRKLVAMNARVVGVCTLRESSFNSDHVDLLPIAEESGIPGRYVTDLHDNETMSWIRERNPDVIFCFGWSRLIREPLLSLSPLGVVGFHPAELPANRGRHPLIWALVLGLKESASTFFFMNEKVDAGPILSQVKFPISSSYDAEDLYRKVTDIALQQIEEFVPKLESGKFSKLAQDVSLSDINTWRKRGAADGRIDWRMSAESITNLVRGLSKPYCGAHFDYQGDEVKVWRASLMSGAPENIEPGKVLLVDSSSIIVKAGRGAVRIRVEPGNPLPKVGSYL